jgi:DNA-binding response OmpR family regulator
VEDNKKVQTLNKYEFEERGYTVELAFTLEEAREAIGRETPGLIILDINMPDGDGLDFLYDELRAPASACHSVPVLMLTGYGEDRDVVKGFESGCNDYMGKPYTFPVLFMRTKELLSRASKVPDILEKGNLKLDLLAKHAFVKGEDLLLKPKEFSILMFSMQHEDEILSAERLYETIWKSPISNDKRTLQSHISAIRKKLEDACCDYTIRVVYGKGYIFEKV